MSLWTCYTYHLIIYAFPRKTAERLNFSGLTLPIQRTESFPVRLVMRHVTDDVALVLIPIYSSHLFVNSLAYSSGRRDGEWDGRGVRVLVRSQRESKEQSLEVVWLSQPAEPEVLVVRQYYSDVGVGVLRVHTGHLLARAHYGDDGL